MKTRANTLLTMTASALTLFAAQAFPAMAATAPARAQSPKAAPADPEAADTLVYSATKSLIESFGELTKTASKLSETALKLLEAQESLDAKQESKTRKVSRATEKKTYREKESSPEKKTSPAKKEATTSGHIEHTPVFIEEEETYTATTIEPAQPTPAVTQVFVRDTVYVTVRDTTELNTWYLPGENLEGGQYIWVPDGNLSSVQAMLDGEVPDKEPAPDLSEMTFWRGDSIPMALPTKRLGRYDRKLYNWLIYPKGLWHIGLSANYGELNTEDSEFLSLIQDVDLHGKIYSIKPSVSYFLRNNLCVGMRLAFTKGDMAVNSFNVDIDEDMSFNLHDIKYTSDSYSAAVFIQQYFGLTRRGRFAVFNEAEVSYGSGSSHFIRPFDGNIRDTRTKSQSFNINYSPGVSIMMMKNAAFNLSFGIFGFHLKNEKQWENGEESGSRLTSGINFRFNLFNINFGVSIII